MKELSVFVDESGDIDGESRYYLLALVFHDQSNELTPTISLYEQSLNNRDLPNILFHFSPLLRANERYHGPPMRLSSVSLWLSIRLRNTRLLVITSLHTGRTDTVLLKQ